MALQLQIHYNLLLAFLLQKAYTARKCTKPLHYINLYASLKKFNSEDVSKSVFRKTPQRKICNSMKSGSRFRVWTAKKEVLKDYRRKKWSRIWNKKVPDKTKLRLVLIPAQFGPLEHASGGAALYALISENLAYFISDWKKLEFSYTTAVMLHKLQFRGWLGSFFLKLKEILNLRLICF